jgi:hypothetical protein
MWEENVDSFAGKKKCFGLHMELGPLQNIYPEYKLLN